MQGWRFIDGNQYPADAGIAENNNANMAIMPTNHRPRHWHQNGVSKKSRA
jgi:hypothetical protein